MSGFDDLLAAGPYLDVEYMAETQGASWVWSYLVVDNDKALVDMRTGYTGSLSIRGKNDVTDLVPVEVTFPAIGGITCTADVLDTEDATPGLYYHELTVVRDSDGATLVVVGAFDSIFEVKRKVALPDGS